MVNPHSPPCGQVTQTHRLLSMWSKPIQTLKAQPGSSGPAQPLPMGPVASLQHRPRHQIFV